MRNEIIIESVNYLGSDLSRKYNAKVLYKKNGKLNLAHIYIDFFNESVNILFNQPKECKVLKGLSDAVKYNKLRENNLI